MGLDDSGSLVLNLGEDPGAEKVYLRPGEIPIVSWFHLLTGRSREYHCSNCQQEENKLFHGSIYLLYFFNKNTAKSPHALDDFSDSV